MILIQKAKSANLFDAPVPVTYPDILKTSGVGSARNATAKIASIPPGVGRYIQYTVPDKATTHEAGIIPAGDAYWNGTDYSQTGLALAIYQLSYLETRCIKYGATRQSSENDITDGSVVKIIEEDVAGTLKWRCYIDGVLKGPSQDYEFTGAVDFYMGVIGADGIIEDLVVSGGGGVYDLTSGYDLTPSETIGSGTPATWTGSETVSFEITDLIATITLPTASNALRYEVFVNDVQYGSYNTDTTTVTLPYAVNADVVRVEAIGADGITTATGPTVALGITAPEPTAEYSTLAVDTSSPDLSETGIMPSLYNAFADTTTSTQTVTNANFVATAEAAVAGTKLVLSSGHLIIGDVSNAIYQVITINGGTRDNPIVVVPANFQAQAIRSRMEIRGTGHLVFEGWNIDNCGGPFGAVNAYAPGVVLASCVFTNFYSWPMTISGDAAGAGHWSGLFNCYADFTATHNDVISIINLNTVAESESGIQPVGTFVANCYAYNLRKANRATCISSVWQGAIQDPAKANYLHARDRFIRVFHLDVNQHDCDDECVSMKFSGMHIHGVRIRSSSSGIVGRYTNDSIVTGYVHDVNGGVRNLRIHGDKFVARWNLEYNGTSARGFSMSVEDQRTDEYGPHARGIVNHFYQATTNMRATENIFEGNASMGRLLGPDQRADDRLKLTKDTYVVPDTYGAGETAGATGNEIRAIYLTESESLPLAIIDGTGGPPNQDYAQWSIDNPDALSENQIYLKSAGENVHDRTSGDFPFDWTSEPRPNAWPDDPNDPLKRFAHIHNPSVNLAPGKLFESVVTTT